MIERHDEDGFTAVYIDADFEPADADTAVMVKLVYDDGTVKFLIDPDAEAAPDEVEPEPADPVTDEIDDEDHEHHGKAWAKHRRRTGQRDPLKIKGHELAHWARNIAAQDAERIHTAISVGLTAGEDNTDIVHRVIGSRRLNGVNGATEITRQHILRLGKGLLHKRKSHVAGSSSE